MDLQQSERYFHGYILVPCYPEDFRHNQPQSLQAIPSSYTSSIRKYDGAVLPEQNQNQPTTASRNIWHHGDCTCRVVFPAIYRQQPRAWGVSRHKIGVESLPVSCLGGRY